MSCRVSLSQWLAFSLLAEHGNYKDAANKVHKTQSSIFHAVKKLEQSIGQKLYTFNQKGITLTALGEQVLPRVRRLLADAEALEKYCTAHDLDGEPELSVAIDVTTPPQILTRLAEQYSTLYRGVMVRIYETALSGAARLLERGAVDIAVAANLPSYVVANELLSVKFVCVASPDHPCNNMGTVTLDDLRDHCQIVIADSNRDDPQSSGWLQARQRWTVSHIDTSRRMLLAGQGFAWFPEAHIRKELAEGSLKRIPLNEKAERVTHLHVGYLPDSNEFIPLLDFVGTLKDVFYEYAQANADA